MTTTAERDRAEVAASDAIDGDMIDSFKVVGSWWREFKDRVGSRSLIRILLEHADVR